MRHNGTSRNLQYKRSQDANDLLCPPEIGFKIRSPAKKKLAKSSQPKTEPPTSVAQVKKAAEAPPPPLSQMLKIGKAGINGTPNISSKKDFPPL